MYTMKNGILMKDGKPVYGLGAAYYPSFHAKKMPVPPEGDQYGEAEKDLQLMKEIGLNLVRTAALGNLTEENRQFHLDSPLIDFIMKRIGELDMASMIRIQGYSMKTQDYEGAEMVDQNGMPYNTHSWSNFIQDTLHHPQILADNHAGTAEIARHFLPYPNLTSFITYNEPHYPASGVFDYNPMAIANYRKWLVKKGYKTEEEAASLQPPTRRPLPGEDLNEWTYWRMFAVEAMSNFLNSTAAVSKAEGEQIESMTCMTPNMLEFDNYVKGCDYFDVAEGMDVLGLTLYKNCQGGDYYTTNFLLNCAESAAAVCGKHYWLIELDNATNIPGDHFNRQSYLAVGTGCKGIVYYQWRGDYPFEGAPEPNGFGFRNSDGSKAPNFDNGVRMVSLLNKLSDEFVRAEKVRSGAAILYSPYAAMLADAVDNGFETQLGVLKNTYIERMRRYYYELHRNGLAVDVVKTCHLAENRLGVKAVFVPAYELLSETEKQELDAFIAQGGKVFLQATDRWQKGLVKNGFEELHAVKEKFDACWQTEEALEYAGISPIVSLSTTALGIDTLENENSYVISLINLSKLHDRIENAELTLHAAASGAEFFTTTEQISLKVENGKIRLPAITDGAFVIIRK